MRTCEHDPYWPELVGAKLKALRKKRGVSQAFLALRIGVSMQQIGKYERGTDNIPIPRLLTIAARLRVDPNYFWTLGYPDTVSGPPPEEARVVSMLDDNVIALIESYKGIKDPALRKKILRFVSRLSAGAAK